MRTWKSLALGLFLIAAASGVLLVSDWVGKGGRLGGGGDPAAELHRKVRAKETVRVAILKWTSSSTLDETCEGLVAGLAERGFAEGKNLRIETLCAEGDMPTAVSLAHRAFGGEFDLVLTVSTPMLQVGAQANREGKVVQVFGAVTDPYGAGVGIDREDHRKHPAWLAGVGTFQPVAEAVRLARTLFPGVKRLGTVMNPSEACSQSCFALAKKTCDAMGIELLATHADNSSGVREAASALAARGVQGFLIGGDNTVETAFSSVVRAAEAAGIPVLGYASDYARVGALAGLGADYRDVGRIQARVAADILEGRSPAEIPVENVMPLTLSLNLRVAERLRDPWRIPPEVESRAALVYDRKGLLRASRVREAGEGTRISPAPRPSRKWDLHFLNYVDSVPTEDTLKGFRRGLREAGLREGEDFVLTVANAQGDMSTLATLADNVLTRGADLLLVTSTPTLQTVLRKTETLPVVFGIVANPAIAGAGSDDRRHRPNVTGISSLAPYAEGVRILRECLPGVRRVGTLENPSESNCVYNLACLRRELSARGIECVSVPVSTSTEIPDGIRALLSQNVEAVVQISGNLFFSSFPPISRACLEARVPLFAFDTATAAKGGAAVAVARDYESGGADMARVALRVLRGESPGAIPFAPIGRIRITLNEGNARRYGLTLPASLRGRADRIVP